MTPIIASAEPTPAPATLRGLRGLRGIVVWWRALVAAIVFRFACYAAMTALAIGNEMRAAPSVPDLLVASTPYVAWVDRLNYVAWLLTYLPMTLVFLYFAPALWARYNVSAGLVSLARGACLALTGLGPPDPAHAGPGVGATPFAEVFAQLVSPFGIFARGSARVYLTKDLFFSGHTATTFLLLLYVWRWPNFRAPALVAHASAVASVIFAHLHYGIDVVGAWGVTFALYALREWRPRPDDPAAGRAG